MQPIYIPNRIGKITAAKNVIAVSKHRSETGSRVGFVQGVSSGGAAFRSIRHAPSDNLKAKRKLKSVKKVVVDKHVMVDGPLKTTKEELYVGGLV